MSGNSPEVVLSSCVVVCRQSRLPPQEMGVCQGSGNGFPCDSKTLAPEFGPAIDWSCRVSPRDALSVAVCWCGPAYRGYLLRPELSEFPGMATFSPTSSIVARPLRPLVSSRLVSFRVVLSDASFRGPLLRVSVLAFVLCCDVGFPRSHGASRYGRSCPRGGMFWSPSWQCRPGCSYKFSAGKRRKEPLACCLLKAEAISGLLKLTLSVPRSTPLLTYPNVPTILPRHPPPPLLHVASHPGRRRPHRRPLHVHGTYRDCLQQLRRSLGTRVQGRRVGRADGREALCEFDFVSFRGREAAVGCEKIVF